MTEEGHEQWGRFEIAVAGSSHVGRIRKVNQDAFDRFDSPDRDELLLVVADGMGGHSGGETASRMAVGILGRIFEEGEIAGEGPADRLARVVERANFEIHRLSRKDETLAGMGTTVVALLLRTNGPSYVAHVGDSRLYRLRDGELVALTEDHSVVSLLLRNGSISPEEAWDHPKRNQIMRALGVRESLEVEIAPVEPRAGDRFLLCSDGVHAMLRDPDIRKITTSAPDVHAAVAWLIDAANQAGGMDNVTAMVVAFEEPMGGSDVP